MRQLGILAPYNGKKIKCRPQQTVEVEHFRITGPELLLTAQFPQGLGTDARSSVVISIVLRTRPE